jgi:hypothetical protein
MSGVVKAWHCIAISGRVLGILRAWSEDRPRMGLFSILVTCRVMHPMNISGTVLVLPNDAVVACVLWPAADVTRCS